jgi:hypothetical protein
MLSPANLRPHDRVLLLGIPSAAEIAALAGRLPAGLLVAMGPAEQVCESRRVAAALDNVMFVPLPDDGLPWRDGFFNLVADLIGEWPDPARMALEIRRVSVE